VRWPGFSRGELIYLLGLTRVDVLRDALPPSSLGKLSASGKPSGSSGDDESPVPKLARWSNVQAARRRAVVKQMTAQGRPAEEIALEVEILDLRAEGLSSAQILEKVGADRMAAHSPHVDVAHRYLLLRAHGVTEREAAELTQLDKSTARRHFRASIDAIMDELGGEPDDVGDRTSRAPACMNCAERPRTRLPPVKRKKRGQPPVTIHPERQSSFCRPCLVSVLKARGLSPAQILRRIGPDPHGRTAP